MKAVRRLSLAVALVLLASMFGAVTASGGEPAKGEPVVIGVYTPADNSTFTAPELIPAVEAAAEFVTKEQNGLGGRPIKVVSCKTNYTPDSLTSCANRLFQQNPLLIIPGPDASAFTAFSTFANAGVPLIGGASFTPPEYTSNIRVMFNGFSASVLPGQAYFAIKELKAKKLVALSFDDGINPVIVRTFMDPIARANGLSDVQFIPTQPGTADFTAPLGAAIEADPDAILAFGVPCVPLIKAYASLGAKVPLVQPSNCNDPKTLSRAGKAAEGAYYVSEFFALSTNPKNKDVKQYQRIIKKYGKGNIVPTDFSFSGVAAILNIKQVLDNVDLATATPDQILGAFRGVTNQPNFLAEPYTCQPPPVSQWPAICSGSVFFTRVKDGKLRQTTSFVSMSTLYGGP
jgi:branched-chain amino acid transport system substrate-binding protein